MRHRSYERSVPEIIGDLLNEFPTLLRKESRLARAEMSENMSRMAMGIILVAIGAVLLIPALVVLLEAGVAALERSGFQPPIAALIAGGCALVVGIILALIGVSRVKLDTLVPDKTIHQIQEDVAMARRQVRQDNEFDRAA
jgi:hypothetical protein